MNSEKQSSTAGVETRRNFIKKAATATAVVASANLFKTPVYGQNTAPSTGRVIGANDRIAVAYVGIGGGTGADGAPPSNCPGMGMAHVKSQKAHAADNNIVQAAVCDLYSKRVDVAKAVVGTSDVVGYDDYRKIIDRKDIDAVLIATHDVWHAQCAIDAMTSGKHVYCEKPMTRYLGEGFEVAEVVKKTGKIFQLGSQGCSASAWHKAAELIQAGRIGKLIWAQGFYCRNNPKGEWNYSFDPAATAQTVRWDSWQGKVKDKVAYSDDRFFRWRKFYPYCAGLLGDLVPHRLLPLMLASGSPEFPKRVVCVGTHAVNTDKGTPGALERNVPEHVELIAEFPSGFMITVVSSSVNATSPGFVIYGHQGTINLGDQGNRLALVPERPFADEIDPVTLDGLEPHEDVGVHEKNWFDCIRANKQPNASIDIALKAQAVISLAEMSDRLGVACLFDEKTRKITTGDGKEIPAFTYGWSGMS